MSSFKKLLALFLVLALVFQVIPFSTFAEAKEAAKQTAQETGEQIADQASKETDSASKQLGQTVVGEVTSLRGQSEKHFRMDDGSFIAVDYGMPVHFSEDNGATWLDIDNTLVLNQTTETGRKQAANVAGYKAVNGENAHSFAADLRSGFLFSAQSGSHSLFFSLADDAANQAERNVNEAETPVEAEPAQAEKTAEAAEPEETEPAESEPAEETESVETEVSADAAKAVEKQTPAEETEAPAEEAPETEPAETVATVEVAEVEEEAYFCDAAAEISYPGGTDSSGDKKSSASKAAPSIAEQVQPKKLEADVLYRNVFPGVDLRYELFGNNVKETIVVNKARDSYSFSFYMNLTDLTPVLMEDGSVELRDAKDEVIYLIPAPYMTDAKDAESTDACYTLEQTASGAWKLTIVADEKWVNDKERAFPVEIDPTVYDIVNWTNNGVATTYIVQGDPNLAHENCQEVGLGYTNVYPENLKTKLQENQIFVGVDRLPTVPTGSEVIGVAYGLAPWHYSGSSSMIAEAHEVIIAKPTNKTNYNWIYESCWNDWYGPNKPSPLSNTVLDYAKLEYGCPNYYFWDITKLAKRWYETDQNSAAWADQTRAFSIKILDASSFIGGKSTVVSFWGYGSKCGPILAVSYRNTTGIESYYTYQSMSAGRAGSAYISDYTGALTTVTPLGSYASTVNPVSLSMIYNSSYFAEKDETVHVPRSLNYGFFMGSGATLNYLQKVEYELLQDDRESTDKRTYIKYTDGDGTVHYFATDSGLQEKEPAGSPTYYYDEDGLGLKIFEESAGNFCMKDDKDNKMTFINGFLTTIEDANGNQINLFFRHLDGTMDSNGYPRSADDRLEYVKQKNAGQATATTVFTLGYEDTAYTYKKLRSVTDNAGTVIRFEYDGNRLNIISRKTASESNYTIIAEYGYSGSGSRMTKMRDAIANYALSFSYTDGVISGVQESFGKNSGSGTVTGGGADVVERIPGEKTVYTDWGLDNKKSTAEDNITTVYLFDNAGHTVNAYSMDNNSNIIGASNAVYTETSGTDRQKNRVVRGAGIGMAAMPLVRNGSFEREGNNEPVWQTAVPSGQTAAVVREGELSRTGTKAMKLWSQKCLSNRFVVSHETDGRLAPGQTYTASVYVNTSQAELKGSTKGIWLEATDESGNTYTGDVMRFITNDSNDPNDPDDHNDSGWYRICLTFTATNNDYYTIKICSQGMKGVTYFDDFQLELGDGPSNFNLLQNGGLNYSGDTWLDESNNAASFEENVGGVGNGAYCLEIAGAPAADKYIHQTVSVNQPGSQTYVLSGWAKADAVPDNLISNDTAPEEDKNKQFGLRAVLTYEGESTKEYHYVPFNPDVTDWQFASLAIVPEEQDKTVSTIQVICAYEKNANTAYFDNISLVKEAAQTMRYDEDGHLVSVKSSGTEEQETSYENGNLKEVTTETSGTFHYDYDDHHNLTTATSDLLKETYTYDAAGNVMGAKLTNAAETSKEITSSRTYTNHDNLVKTVTDASGGTVQYEYKTSKFKQSVVLGLPTKTKDPKGTAVETNYDEFGRVTSSWIASYVAVSNEYDARGRLETLVRGGYNKNEAGNTQYSQKYKFSYNDYGQTTRITLGTTNLYTLAKYTYAANGGPLTQVEYGNGATVNYTYDKFGRNLQTTTSSGDEYSYAYTGDGQLYQMKDVAGNLDYRYSYDTLGRLTGSYLYSDSSLQLQTQVLYDEFSRVSGQTWTLPEDNKTYQEEYRYDTNGRLDEKLVTLPDGTSANIDVDYDSLSRLATIESPVSTIYYNFVNLASGNKTTGRVSQMSVNPKQTGSDVFERLYYKYQYDALGNITQIQELLPDNSVYGTTNYTYDNQSQLLQAQADDGRVWTYQYDTYGNLRSKNYLAAMDPYTYTYTYGDANWIDRLTGLTVRKNNTTKSGTYTYDNAGNPTQYFNPGDLTTWTMFWKNGRELANASNDTHTVSCDYDVSGLRTYKIVDGVRHDYVYASGQLLRETFTQNQTEYTLDFLYDTNGRPYILNLTTVNANGTITAPYYYLLNLQGDVVGLTNAAGKLVAEYDYDPFGGLTYVENSTVARLNPLRYRGYYYDSETGFYYLQSRYYDPALGRFINADSYGSTGQGFLGYNMFAYCNNNPVLCADPSGFVCVCVVLEGGGSHKEIDDHVNEEIDDHFYYTSMDDAAFAAGIVCSEETQLTNNEWGVVIYKNEKGFYLGSYIQGEHAGVNFPEFIPGTVAVVHSHPYCTGHVANEFSFTDMYGNIDGDAYVCFRNQICVYLAAPNGTLNVLVPRPYGVDCYMNIRAGLPIDNTEYDCMRGDGFLS